MTTRALLLAAVLFAPLALLPLRASAPSGSRAALASPVRSRTRDLAFWTGEHAAGTAVWRRALAACRSPSVASATSTTSETSETSGIAAGAPGCTAVRLASWWGPTPLPPPVWLLAAPFAAAGAEGRQ